MTSYAETARERKKAWSIGDPLNEERAQTGLTVRLAGG
jgi:hypothetical protein